MCTCDHLHLPLVAAAASSKQKRDCCIEGSLSLLYLEQASCTNNDIGHRIKTQTFFFLIIIIINIRRITPYWGQRLQYMPLLHVPYDCSLQGQLCGLWLWIWPKQKMRMILQIKMTLQKWRCKNDAAKMTSQVLTTLSPWQTAVVLRASIYYESHINHRYDARAPHHPPESVHPNWQKYAKM